MIFLVVYIIPRLVYDFTIPSGEVSLARGLRWVCSRVRTTSWGYVAIDAVIFATPEQNNIVLLLSGTSGFFSARITVRFDPAYSNRATHATIFSAARKEETEQRHAGYQVD